MEKITLTAEEVGQMLGISRSKAFELVKSKGFPSFFVGKRIIIPRDSFLRWLEKQVEEQAAV